MNELPPPALLDRISSLEKQLGERIEEPLWHGTKQSLIEELKALRHALLESQSKVRAFEEAMERERKPDWIKSHMDLADRLDKYANQTFWKSDFSGTDLHTAARELRYMAQSFCLKANFVPSNLRIKQLEQALRGVKVLLERCIRADDFNDALTTINSVLGGNP